jgi:hypothetical protein
VTKSAIRFRIFPGDPPTDEKVKDMITDYLVEKYS